MHHTTRRLETMATEALRNLLLARCYSHVLSASRPEEQVERMRECGPTMLRRFVRVPPWSDSRRTVKEEHPRLQG